MTPIETFTNEYPGRLYYYALKKTGSEQDAADLAADICYEAACALLRGLAPQDLDAWVWAVARNRWARWARKNYYRDPGTEDLSDYAEELASEDDVEANVVHAEELALIRRCFSRTARRRSCERRFGGWRRIGRFWRPSGPTSGTSGRSSHVTASRIWRTILITM